LPLAGKTTIFNALTRSQAQTGASGSSRDTQHTAIVDVADSRVDILTQMYNPRKTTRAQVQFTDVSGAGSGGETRGLDQALINSLSHCDALALVVRAFASEYVPHPRPACS